MGYGGAYLRVIPEGRTPSAWVPTDNVSPFRATPLSYTGCRSRRIDCVLSCYVEIKRKKNVMEEVKGKIRRNREENSDGFR